MLRRAESPVHDVAARRQARRQKTLLYAGSALVLVEIGFITLNLTRGYLEPVPVQVAILLAAAGCVVAARFERTVKLAAHLFMVVSLASAIGLTHATGDAGRITAWLPALVAFSSVTFERRREVFGWAAAIAATGVVAIELADSTPFPNAHLAIVGLVVLVAIAVGTDIALREQLARDLEAAHNRVLDLERILPICMHCKNVRDDDGTWRQLESFVAERTGKELSHGLCDACAEHYWGEPAAP